MNTNAGFNHGFKVVRRDFVTVHPRFVWGAGDAQFPWVFGLPLKHHKPQTGQGHLRLFLGAEDTPMVVVGKHFT